nr:unnamed protein product [Callosobruchus analis]
MKLSGAGQFLIPKWFGYNAMTLCTREISQEKAFRSMGSMILIIIKKYYFEVVGDPEKKPQ